MKVKNKKISLAVCSLLAMAAIVGGTYSVSNVQDVAAEAVVAKYVETDTETKSAWESAGYGTEGYLIMGANASNKAAAYSNMYTEQGNNGKTEITMTRGGNTYWYYDSACTISTDSTAPISGFMLNGSSIWQNGNQSKTSYLYIPGTETTYPGRIHNNMTSVYRDFGLGFNLRETEKTYVSVYVSDWNAKASESLPITVGLYSGIKTATIQGFSSGGVVDRTTSMTDHYGTALAETTLTTGAGAYVTFAIEGAGDYQIVAYYNNQDASTDASIIPMFSGLFFDKDGFEEEIVTPTIEVSLDTETKSAWESAGYGTDGYLVFGVNTSNKPAVYSDMYTKQGNDGKTEITLYKNTDNSYYYDSNLTTTDSTAPISKFVVNGQSAWQQIAASYWTSQPDLYIPGMETTYPVRLHNNHDGDAYHDLGVGFSLTATEKTYVTVYVIDWSKKVSDTNPITVGLFDGIQSRTFYGYGSNTAETLEEHYGTVLSKTTVTSQGTYVTFAIEGAGDYQIVAYYDNQDLSTAASISPMITGLFFDEPEPALPEITTSVFVDTTSKSAWEANGYGTDGYVVFGVNESNKPAAYSNMYTSQGNDGKTEISLYKYGNNTLYYDSSFKTMDDSAPISEMLINSSHAWQAPTGTYWVGQPDLYIPGTETTYPVRLHNNKDCPYHDLGLAFTLRETEKIYVSVYIQDWSKAVSASKQITVGLFNSFQRITIQGNSSDVRDETIEQHYGEALAKTTVTSQGAYVTFAIEGAGNYQIVAYYDNQDPSTNAPVTPLITGLFFDKEIYPEVTSTSLSLEGDIGVNYYVGARGQDLTGGYLQVKYANGNIQQVPVPDRNTDGTYKFQVKIAAKDYAAKMKVRLFDKDGNAISKAFTYSAASYVKSILSAGAAVYGEKLVALATALDDYGKAAENLFYGESNTFTADLSTVTTSTLTTHKFSVSGSLPVGVKLSDFSLSLKSTTSLKIYFTATSLDGVDCKVGDMVVAPEATGVANEYCIVIENINAKDLDTNYVVSIGGYQLTLSTLSYSLRALEYSSNASLKTAMQALYLYNQAANAYFEEA